MAYTVEQKAVAIAVVSRYENQVSSAAIDEIRRLLDLPNLTDRTVRNWVKEFQSEGAEISVEIPKKKVGPKVTEAHVQAAQLELDELFENTARAYLEHANKPAVISETKGPQAVTAAAIAFDKMRLARGLPTEIIGILPEVLEALQRAGKDPYDVFLRLKEAANGSIGNQTPLH